MAEEKNEILVVGSINMDLVVRARQMPLPGETIHGKGFTITPGGKGANQAVAVARLGGKCRMIGRVGEDAFGRTLLEGLKAEGIDCQYVKPTPAVSTGVAMIVVDAAGENAIILDGGANSLLTPDDLFSKSDAFKQAAVVLLQLELPIPTVRATIELARSHGCKVILDPAPAGRQVPEELYKVDILTPNTIEAEIITGTLAIEQRIDKIVATDLIARGPSAVVLKLGPRGSLVVTADGHFYTVPPYQINVVDTTGAGDAFTAALAVAVCRGDKLHAAAKFANAAGALACTKFGAQVSMPTAADVGILMEDQPI